MVDIITWPPMLAPGLVRASPVPMTRSGGPTLAGIQEAIETDVGWWSIYYGGIGLYDEATRRVFQALRVSIRGRSGIFRLPVWSHDSAGWPSGSTFGQYLTPHSDGSTFSDGSMYSQPVDPLIMVESAAIGDVEVKISTLNPGRELSGIRWSYNDALYENGLPSLVEGDEWTLRIFPAVRAPIPAGAILETGMPTCLCHLASDREMDGSFSSTRFDLLNISFVEAHDYWSNLAED